MAKRYRGSANYASSCRIDHFQHENSDCDDYQAGLLRPMYAASQVMSVCIYDRDFHLTLTALLHYTTLKNSNVQNYHRTFVNRLNEQWLFV